MTRDEAIAILEMDREDAIQAILILAEKAEKYDQLCDTTSPTTPSGMTPPYLKPTSKRKKRPCGRKPGHKGISRKRPETITAYKTHTLERCPDCQQALQKPIDRPDQALYRAKDMGRNRCVGWGQLAAAKSSDQEDRSGSSPA